jgi:hypothetical protein
MSDNYPKTTLLIAVIGAVVGVVGIFEARDALTVAKESRDESREANRISREVQERQSGRTIPLLYAHYWDRPAFTEEFLEEFIRSYKTESQ